MKSKFIIAASVVAAALVYPAAAWAAVTFAPAVNYASGDKPRSVAIGDLDGDGTPDLVVANEGDDNVSVLLGNGDGTFAAAGSYAAGDQPHSVAIGDLNADGKPDLVTASNLSEDVSVLFGNGDGTFAPAVSYSVGHDSLSVTIGDLDGDSDLDLVVGNLNNNEISVLLGNGNGTFAAAVDYLTGVDPIGVAIADLDGDGVPDLATANKNSDTVSVLLGNGNGTFAAAVHYPAGNGSASVAARDLNGDGKLDLATADLTTGAASVLLGNGDGSFGAPSHYPTVLGSSSVAIGDVDGDSELDLVTANFNSTTVSVLLGNGDGTFEAAANHQVGQEPFSVAIGDLNGDARLDLATANWGSDHVSVLLNLETFTTGPTASISGTVRQGQTLTAGEGTPVPQQDSFAYQWLADGVPIGGATAKTFELTSAEVGKKISVTVTAKKAGLTDASDTSPETVPVEGIFTPGPTASISGLRRVGSTLTANTGSPSPTPDSFAYRWFLDGKQLATKTKTLKLGAGTAGKRIRVKVHAIKAGYLTAADLSAPTAPISNLQAKTISMELNDYTVARGQRVYAEIELLAPNEPFSIVLDGVKLASGYANTNGVAVKAFTVPANATIGPRILHAYGKFTDRTDPDRITIR